MLVPSDPRYCLKRSSAPIRSSRPWYQLQIQINQIDKRYFFYSYHEIIAVVENKEKVLSINEHMTHCLSISDKHKNKTYADSGGATRTSWLLSSSCPMPGPSPFSFWGAGGKGRSLRRRSDIIYNYLDFLGFHFHLGLKNIESAAPWTISVREAFVSTISHSFSCSRVTLLALGCQKGRNCQISRIGAFCLQIF